MSDKNKSQDASKGRSHPIVYEIFFVVMLVFVVALISYSAGRETAGKNILFLNAKQGIGQSDTQVAAVDAQDGSPVVAIVNDQKITRNEVLELVNAMPQQMQQFPSEQLIPLAVEQMINNKIVDSKASQANLGGNIDVQKQLAQARQQIIRGKFIENEISKAMTDDRIKEAYDAYVKDFPDVEEVKAAHILVEDEATAKDVIAKLSKGGDFAALAKENSKDGTAGSGGDLGYFAKSDVVPEFAEAAFSMKPGAYTKEPVKTNFGYHVIKVENKRKRPAADFATAKPYIEQELRRTILDEIVMKWREKADIERFDINGNPLKAPEDQEPAAGASDAESEVAAPEAAAKEEAPAEGAKEAAE